MNKEGSFVHLNTMSSFTPGSLGDVEEYARIASLFGMPALGIADVNHTEAWTNFDAACEIYGIKPLFGVTVYPFLNEKDRSRVSLLVEETRGFNTIHRLLHQIKETPLSFETLAAYTQGLLALAPKRSYQQLTEYMDPGSLFFEYQNMGDKRSGTQLASDMYYAQNINAQVAGSNHVWKSTPRLYDQVLSLSLLAHRNGQNLHLNMFTGANFAENRSIYDVITNHIFPHNLMDRASAFHPEGWMKPGSMMAQLGLILPDQFDEWKRAGQQTVAIAERCQPKGLPSLSVPEYPVSPDQTIHTELYRRASEGLIKRYDTSLSYEIQDQLVHELDVIVNRNLSSLFLIVDDIASFADTKIGYEAVGSATGSLVAYALGISDVDPIAHNLIAERFLGPEGTKLPDIDVQVDAERRSEIYDFIFTHFPQHEIYPALIATYPTYGLGAALETVLSTFGFDQKQIAEIKRIIKNSPPQPTDQTIMLKDSTNVPTQLLGASQTLANRKLDQGYIATHPSKVIFFDTPVETGAYPLVKYVNGRPVVAMDKDRVKDSGAMEFDAVSSYRLTLLQKILDAHNLKKRRHSSWRSKSIRNDLPRTYSWYSRYRNPLASPNHL